MNIDVFPCNSTRDARHCNDSGPFPGRTITRTLTNSSLVTAARYSAKRGATSHLHIVRSNRTACFAVLPLCVSDEIWSGRARRFQAISSVPLKSRRQPTRSHVLANSTWHTTIHVHVCANTGNICYSAFHNSRDRVDYLCPADMMDEMYLPALLLRQRLGVESLAVLGFFARAFFSYRSAEKRVGRKARRKTNEAFVANPNVNGNTSVDR